MFHSEDKCCGQSSRGWMMTVVKKRFFMAHTRKIFYSKQQVWVVLYWDLQWVLWCNSQSAREMRLWNIITTHWLNGFTFMMLCCCHSCLVREKNWNWWNSVRKLTGCLMALQMSEMRGKRRRRRKSRREWRGRSSEVKKRREEEKRVKEENGKRELHTFRLRVSRLASLFFLFYYQRRKITKNKQNCVQCVCVLSAQNSVSASRVVSRETRDSEAENWEAGMWYVWDVRRERFTPFFGKSTSLQVLQH